MFQQADTKLEKMKTRVNSGLRYLTIPEKIQTLRLYANNIDAFPNDFPGAHPTSAILNQIADSLESAYAAAQNGGVNETALLHDKERIADAYLTELAHYVEDLPTCTPDLVHKMGMVVRIPGGNQAVIFDVTQGTNAGDTKLRMKSVSGAAYVFQVFKGLNPPLPGAVGDQTWVDLGISSRKALFMASGLLMETKYWFRAASVVGQTQSAWETPISIILV